MTIQLGAHCYLFTDHWSDASLPILDRLRELGGEILEIAVGDDVHFSLPATRRAAEQLNMQLIVSPGGEWPLECDISSANPIDRNRGLAWHRQQIELAAELGAIAYTGALYGHTGVVHRRRPPADEGDRVVEGLQALAEFAAAHSVLLAIEPMSHFRTHLINTPAQAMSLLDRCNHPNLRVLFDTYHLVTEVRDYSAAILEMGERLWGVHACENDRGVPGGGLIPWSQIADGLRKIDFAGPVLLEGYNSSIDDFAFRRGMFHNVCPDADAFVRSGFAFLRAQFGN
jgi:D-psicose/D-tagatose/L-ribulose 3-epimerase